MTAVECSTEGLVRKVGLKGPYSVGEDTLLTGILLMECVILGLQARKSRVAASWHTCARGYRNDIFMLSFGRQFFLQDLDVS